MKKLIILLFVLASILSEAQITIPKDTLLIKVGYIEIDLATYDIRKDTVINGKMYSAK
jgi:hypothetical protein